MITKLHQWAVRADKAPKLSRQFAPKITPKTADKLVRRKAKIDTLILRRELRAISEDLSDDNKAEIVLRFHWCL